MLYIVVYIYTCINGCTDGISLIHSNQIDEIIDTFFSLTDDKHNNTKCCAIPLLFK